MNTDTGELRRLIDPDPTLTKQLMESGFTKVPDEHAEEAETLLDGQQKTVVDMSKDTPLVKWAKEQNRVHSKSNNHKAMQKISRKQNRR